MNRKNGRALGRGRQWRSLVACVICVTGLGASTGLAGATTKPPQPSVKSFKVSAATISGRGASVAFSISIRRAETCKLSVSPSLKSLPAMFPCASGKATRKAANPGKQDVVVQEVLLRACRFRTRWLGPIGSASSPRARAGTDRLGVFRHSELASVLRGDCDDKGSGFEGIEM